MHLPNRLDTVNDLRALLTPPNVLPMSGDVSRPLDRRGSAVLLACRPILADLLDAP
jgi:hypothetical protein